MNILGLNAYHGDASAALLMDGELVAAVEEERFTRLKHQAGFPTEAVRWVLGHADLDINDVDHVAISRDPLRHVHRKIARVLIDRPPIVRLLNRAKNQQKILSIREALGAAFDRDPNSIRCETHRVEHHRAHLASAFFCSPFEKAVCVSIDGMGDFVSGMWARGAGNQLMVQDRVLFPHSLGVYYTAFTQFLGLPKYGDEYKLMGLAAYGEPRFLSELQDVLSLKDATSAQYRLNLDYFVHTNQGVNTTWAGGQPSIKRLWSDRMIEVFGEPGAVGELVTKRDEDLAASVQKHLERTELEMLRRIHRDNPDARLVLAGGVALNCVVNGMIRNETPFEEVWIQPAAHDAGTSIGAALWVQHQDLGQDRIWEMEHVYWGPATRDQQEEKEALHGRGLPTQSLNDDELMPRVASLIADGHVVGWFQGRSEFGPRALGNRSIVCDPRRPDMKDVLNRRIKYREPFRPFAPSILEEEVDKWFDQSYPSPFMLKTYSVLPTRREQVPAITHADGTGRLQTVSVGRNPRYYLLIQRFFEETGVPIVLNTSFNENEPIVSDANEAIDCFLRTDMDVLVLGQHIVEKSHLA